MIPNRLLLRAATVLALTRGGDGPYPTMAGPMVHDTKLLPIEDVKQEAMLPTIIVYTDVDRRTNLSRNNQSSWKRTVTLVLELAISSVSPQGITLAETDAELEALLDLFEAEVEWALNDPTNPYAVFWKSLLRSVDDWQSHPYRSAEQQHRYAVRQLHMDCELSIDCRQHVTTKPIGKIAIPDDLLGIPYLSSLSDDLKSNPLFASTLAMLTSAGAVQVPALKTIGFKVDAVDPADKSRLPPGQTKGPDGRIEIAAVIKTGNTK